MLNAKFEVDRGKRADIELVDIVGRLSDILTSLDAPVGRTLARTERQVLDGADGTADICTTHRSTNSLVRDAHDILNKISEHIAACESSRWSRVGYAKAKPLVGAALDAAIAEYVAAHVPVDVHGDEPDYVRTLQNGEPLVDDGRNYVSVRPLLAWLRETHRSDIKQHTLTKHLQHSNYIRTMIVAVYPSRMWLRASGMSTRDAAHAPQYRLQKPYWYKSSTHMIPTA